MKYKIKTFHQGLIVDCICTWCIEYQRGPFKIVGPASTGPKEILCFNPATGLTRRFNKANLRIHYAT
jgi:hypothetical protein